MRKCLIRVKKTTLNHKKKHNLLRPGDLKCSKLVDWKYFFPVYICSILSTLIYNRYRHVRGLPRTIYSYLNSHSSSIVCPTIPVYYSIADWRQSQVDMKQCSGYVFINVTSVRINHRDSRVWANTQHQSIIANLRLNSPFIKWARGNISLLCCTCKQCKRSWLFTKCEVSLSI